MKIPASLFILLLTVSINAATFTVTRSDDRNATCVVGDCSLREAVKAANALQDSDTIDFNLAGPATITLENSELLISTDLTINGTGARNLIIQRSTVQGTPLFRIFKVIGSSILVNISGVTITNGTLERGDTAAGGGIWSTGGATLNLNEIVVSNNKAQIGGGILNQGVMNIYNSLISGNTMSTSTDRGNGGGINNGPDGRLKIVNSTITNNQSNLGGGIFSFSSTTLINVTVSHNSVVNFGNNGGGVYVAAGAVIGVGSFSARNTIIAQNSATEAPDIYGKLNSLGNNLIGNSELGTGFTNGVNGDQAGTTRNQIDASLGSLQNNGGPTDTRELFSGSPAIDKGNNCVLFANCSSEADLPLSTDQRVRGFLRLYGTTVDIGAYEKQPAVSNQDADGDMIFDNADNCPINSNPDQLDFDRDNIGDACDLSTGPPTLREQCANGNYARFDAPRRFKNERDCLGFLSPRKVRFLGWERNL